MSKAVDLKMRIILDEYINTIGTHVESNRRTIDLTSIGIPQFTEAEVQIFGEQPLDEMDKRDSELDWIEAYLVKVPQTIITPSKCGLSHKKNLYTIFVKTPKDRGLYYNEALSAMVEEHFQNNEHIVKDEEHITIIKTYQQPTIFLIDDLSRYQNRVFIECEIYYKNN